MLFYVYNLLLWIEPAIQHNGYICIKQMVSNDLHDGTM